MDAHKPEVLSNIVNKHLVQLFSDKNKELIISYPIEKKTMFAYQLIKLTKSC